MVQELERKDYFRQRYAFQKVCFRAERGAFLATSDEEFDRYWNQYSYALKKWKELPAPEGMREDVASALQQTEFYRPVFNDAYVNYTQQLKEMYQTQAALPSWKEQRAYNKKIQKVIDLRQMSTSFISIQL